MSERAGGKWPRQVSSEPSGGASKAEPMPIHYQIDPGRREVFAQISGVVSDRELLDEIGRILNDPRFPEARLWDAREREDVPFSDVIEPILDLLRQYESSLGGAKCALVTSQTASFGMQRMFSLRSDSVVEVQAFRDLTQARSWLHSSVASSSA